MLINTIINKACTKAKSSNRATYKPDKRKREGEAMMIFVTQVTIHDSLLGLFKQRIKESVNRVEQQNYVSYQCNQTSN